MNFLSRVALAAPVRTPVRSLARPMTTTITKNFKTRGGYFAAASLTTAGVAGFSFSTCTPEGESPKPLTSLSPKEFRPFTVVKTKKLSQDSALVTFALPSEEHTLGLTVASCLSISADIDGQTVGRPYTPISTKDQKGHVEFVVKAYPARTDGKAGGMGRHLCDLKVGESVNMKGPWNKLAYTANKYQKLGMVAGGTGLTPCLQVISAIVNNPEDTTEVTLLYGNRTSGDILLKARLDALAKEHPRFKVVYTLDAPPAVWSGEKGFVTACMVSKHLPSPADGTMIMVCGPPPMMKSVSGDKVKGKQGELEGVLKELGYGEGQWFKF